MHRYISYVDRRCVAASTASAFQLLVASSSVLIRSRSQHSLGLTAVHDGLHLLVAAMDSGGAGTPADTLDHLSRGGGVNRPDHDGECMQQHASPWNLQVMGQHVLCPADLVPSKIMQKIDDYMLGCVVRLSQDRKLMDFPLVMHPHLCKAWTGLQASSRLPSPLSFVMSNQGGGRSRSMETNQGRGAAAVSRDIAMLVHVSKLLRTGATATQLSIWNRYQCLRMPCLKDNL